MYNTSYPRFRLRLMRAAPVTSSLIPASVKHVVAVSSGKGGVGKSTAAVNIATALANALGLRVGLLDADVYGPSVPRLMNLAGRRPGVIERTRTTTTHSVAHHREADNEKKEKEEQKMSFLSRMWAQTQPTERSGQSRAAAAATTRGAGAAGGGTSTSTTSSRLVPLVNHNVKCMSLGFLLPASDAGNGAVAWRGPMASSSLSRLTADTDWGDLDVLIVDMPPGTGDVHITYVQTDIT